MEIIAGVLVGIVLGAAAAWAGMKLMNRSESAITKQRIGSADQEITRLKEEAQKWQAESMEGSMEVVRLQEQINSVKQNAEATDHSNAELRGEVTNWQSEASGITNKAVQLQAQLDAANRRLDEQGDIEKTLTNQFKVLATEVIDSNSEKFLTAADEKVGILVKQAKSDFDLSKEAVSNLVKPLSDELKRIETARTDSQGSLRQQLETLASSNKALEHETRSLTTALKRPEVRGAWGEIQLRRVVELAGMSEYCDYDVQVSVTSKDGKRDRPDMVVRMPNERTIVIDAKTPMNAYLTAIESNSDLDRETAIVNHARQVRERVRELAQKSYSQLFDHSPDFVVMFLPGEFLLQPALEKDPELIDWAMGQGVVIATPNTLMALLKTVEMGWKEARLAEHAMEVQKIGQELHDRLATYAGHVTKVGSALRSAVSSYNSAVGSFDSRVAVSARKFKELGVPTSSDIPEIDELDAQVRQISARNLPESPMALTGDSIEDDD